MHVLKSYVFTLMTNEKLERSFCHVFTLCKAISVQQNGTYPTVVREKSRAVISCKRMHSVHILTYWGQFHQRSYDVFSS